MADAPLVEYQDECILLVCTQKVKLVLSHLWARVELPATTGYALSKAGSSPPSTTAPVSSFSRTSVTPSNQDICR
ncbi:hypothetical protein U0070_021352 [Myodes glareolus]|uniref:Uncharacterized protein n=1 Tax=Myodes glareolus TaxID=447135 RepID=A0AAW0JHE6_MYOGA